MLFDPLGVTFERKAKKGMRVHVEGSLQDRNWISRDGVFTNVLEIRADNDWTEILDSVEDFDRFANFGKSKNDVNTPTGQAAF